VYEFRFIGVSHKNSLIRRLNLMFISLYAI